ncbi:hypothetical protein LJC23_07615 [Desulfovibrio sp. OttesenSCG-928-I05]|nr:hypothetical protein [Desulfovibrio sp. OttesenSCG-928-I05]
MPHVNSDANTLYATLLNHLVRVALAALCLSYLSYFFMEAGVSPESIAGAWHLSSSEYAAHMANLPDSGSSLLARLPDFCVVAVGSISLICITVLAVHFKRRGESLHWKLAAALAVVFAFAMSGLANRL